jgi:hypothetical protein
MACQYMSTKQKLLTILAVLVITSIATTSMVFTNQEAAAQFAATGPTKQVQGGGTSGTVTCPDGTSASPASISFSSNKDKGKQSGGGTINDQTALTEISVSISGGSLKQGTFTLQGVEGDDSICHIPGSSLATISGLCGAGVTIQYRDTIGRQGIFPNSNVACFA